MNGWPSRSRARSPVTILIGSVLVEGARKFDTHFRTIAHNPSRNTAAFVWLIIIIIIIRWQATFRMILALMLGAL